MFSIFEVSPNDGKFKYIIKTVLARFFEHDVARVSGQLAYFILLSIFPFLIFFNALIASFDISTSQIISFLRPAFPEQIVSLINDYVMHISQNQSASLLSIGIIVMIFSASKSMRSLSYSINTAYEIEDRKGFFKDIFLSMLYIVAAGVILVMVVLFVTLSDRFLTEIIQVATLPAPISKAIAFGRWVIMIAILFLILSIMYKTVPNRKVRIKQTIPGTALAVLGFLVLTSGFSLYVNYFLKNSIFYGTIGAVILLMFWIYFASVILVMGAELNHIVEQMPLKKR